MATTRGNRSRVVASASGLVAGAALLASALFSPAAEPAAPQGGTLRIDSLFDPGSVDPAINYGGLWSIEGATCLRLLNYPDRDVEVSKLRFAPEAAARFPSVSRDGKTYTFTVPRGRFTFNTGEAVTAATFAHVLNRGLSPKLNSPAATFLSDVVGAKDVLKKKASAASGIVVRGDKLAVTLTRVAPDFLARITMPFFCALPLGTPDDHELEAPVPSAGPYFIASRVPKREVVVLRNPLYRGSRPHNVDEIRATIGVAVEAQQLRVEKGETDIGGFPPATLSSLIRNYGINKERLFIKPQLVVWFLYMNTTRPPFNDVRLRRAVNYALDRRTLVRQLGVPDRGRATDQILPPGMPGYRDWDVYPVDGPTQRKARPLARRWSGTKVNLWTLNAPLATALAQVIQYDLGRIGLKVQINLVDFSALGDVRERDHDLLSINWGADYVDPYDFINVVFSGELGSKISSFNSPAWNRRLARVSRLSGDARYKAYGELDRDLMTDAAPAAPLFSMNDVIFLSKRVGCFIYNGGVDLAALCLKP